MKNALTLIFAGIVAVLLASSGCKKSESTTSPQGPSSTSGTASFTLNGAGFSNASFTVSDLGGVFSPSDNMTTILGSSASAADTLLLGIIFPGSSTGTFGFISDSIGVIITSEATSSAFVSQTGSGQITVTAYGNVGGNIAGTFSGKLYGWTQLQQLDSVTVSNGSFNAIRYQ
jgi:hypothetical protein